jgi:hypothetical protein
MSWSNRTRKPFLYENVGSLVFFSYAWYASYQVGLSVIVFSVCVLVAWQGYEDKASMDVALKRGLTLFLAHLGGWLTGFCFWSISGVECIRGSGLGCGSIRFLGLGIGSCRAYGASAFWF